jgi:hypothetical protein
VGRKTPPACPRRANSTAAASDPWPTHDLAGAGRERHFRRTGCGGGYLWGRACSLPVPQSLRGGRLVACPFRSPSVGAGLQPAHSAGCKPAATRTSAGCKPAATRTSAGCKPAATSKPAATVFVDRVPRCCCTSPVGTRLQPTHSAGHPVGTRLQPTHSAGHPVGTRLQPTHSAGHPVGAGLQPAHRPPPPPVAAFGRNPLQ